MTTNRNILIAAEILSKSAPFLVSLILARSISLEDFGIYNTYLATITLLTAIISLGGESGVSVRYFKQEQREFSEYITSNIICSGLILIAALSLLPLYVQTATKIGLSQPIIFSTLVFSFLSSINNLTLTTTQCAKNIKWFCIICLTPAVTIVILTTLILLSQEEINSIKIITCHLASIALTTLLSIAFIKKNKLITKKLTAAGLKSFLGFSTPLLPNIIAGWMRGFYDRYFIAITIGLTFVSLYSVSYQYLSILLVLNTVFARVYSVRLHELLKKDLIKKPMTQSGKAAAVILIAAIPYSAISALSTEMVFGEKYSGIEILTITLTLGGAITIINTIYINHLLYHEKTKQILTASTSSLLIHVLLTTTLIKIFGFSGAGIGYLASTILNCSINYYSSSKIYKNSPKQKTQGA